MNLDVLAEQTLKRERLLEGYRRENEALRIKRAFVLAQMASVRDEIDEFEEMARSAGIRPVELKRAVKRLRRGPPRDLSDYRHGDAVSHAEASA